MDEDAQPEFWSFPTNITDFDNDERISFSRLDGKYIAVQSDGTEFAFDVGLKRWIPQEDEDDGGEEDGHGMDNGVAGAEAERAKEEALEFGRLENTDSSGGAGPNRKRKQDQAYGYEVGSVPTTPGNAPHKRARGSQAPPGSASAPASRKQQRQPPQQRKNTAVYVTGLPADATVEEVAELFSRKCGVIAEEIDSGRPRIKLYTDAASGQFKGDALVVFFKPQSVDMAIMLLDDTDFRPPPPPPPSGGRTGSASSLPPPPPPCRMRVQAADVSYKKTNYQHEPAAEAGGDGNDSTAKATTTPGEETGAAQAAGAAAAASSTIKTAAETGAASGPGSGPTRGGGRASSHQDKQKIIKKTQKLDAKLADWSSDEERGGPSSYHDRSDKNNNNNGRNARWDKVVVLKHMFTLAELDADPAALLDIKEDIRDECAKLGEVTNVVLFDQETDGVVSVKFKTAAAAAACVQLMDGRAFDGRFVEARLASGRERFRRSKKNGEEDKDDNDDDDGGGGE